MQKVNRKISLMILVVISIFVVTFIFQIANAETKVTDIKGHWAEGTINYMINAKAISGYPDGTFKPSNNVTYGEAIKLLTAYYEKGITNSSDYHWAFYYYLFACGVGIIDLRTTYNMLDEYVSRKEVLNIVYNTLNNVAFKPLLKYEEMSAYFPDVTTGINEDGVDYYNIVLNCYAMGIVQGNDEGFMCPDLPVTRAEFITIMERAFLENNRVYSVKDKREQAIITPNNSGSYKYIWEYMPNSFYEYVPNDFFSYIEGCEPVVYAAKHEYNTVNKMVEDRKKTEMSLNALYNIEYSMNDFQIKEWKEKMKLFSNVDESSLDEYIQYIKDNKIAIRGGVIMDPCTIGEVLLQNSSEYKPAMKGLVKIQVGYNENNLDILTYDEFINNKSNNLVNNEYKYILVYLDEAEDKTGYSIRLKDILYD